MDKFIEVGILILLGWAWMKWGSRFFDERSPWQRYIRLVGMVPIGVAVVILVLSIFVIVPAGNVGVQVLFGKVHLGRALPEGLNVVNPLVDVVNMSTRVQRSATKYDAASKDLQAVHVEMVLNFRIVPDQAPEIYKNVGLSYISVIVDPAAQEVLKAQTALHNASEILQKRPLLKVEVQNGITAWLRKYGIELKEASLANIKFDPSYEKAIETKQIEEQKAEQKTYEVTQAVREAEKVVATAKGAAESSVARAKGEAEALKLKGDAEANYNAKVSASLTPVLIQQQYLTKWDGHLPQYQLGGATPLLQIPSAPSNK